MFVTSLRLSGFAMSGVLLAETAVFHQFDAVGGVFLVLFLVVIALFAFGAGQHNVLPRFLRCHVETPLS
jgi:hypothetical protein